jgi:hypothetical protein
VIYIIRWCKIQTTNTDDPLTVHGRGKRDAFTFFIIKKPLIFL